EGPGFAGAIEPLFGRFTRGAAGDGRPPGLGLGLSIARGVITPLGGGNQGRTAALSATLKAAGYRPVTARTAAEGLRWFAHYAPDLVLLDLGLPDRDGLTVIRDIRERATTPIVILSEM